jgi:AcrR family transcriptional regulator
VKPRRTRERRTQAERRAETRAAVLESACRLFGSKGYADTSLEEIAAACGVTIRPIYHYFGGKQQLFEAVNEVMEERILASLESDAESATRDPVVSAWRAFLELCRDPEFRRIVLVDAPSVLGRARWETSAVTHSALGMFRDVGGADRVRGPLVARMLVGALAEAGVAIAESDDPEGASREADAIVTRVIRALLATEDPE